jgi:PASTA domain-containing protein
MEDQRTPPRGYRIPPASPPPPPPGAPPTDSPPNRGFRGWLREHPGAALVAVVLALAGGLAAGFLIGGNQTDEKKRADEAETQLASVENERDGLRARLETAEGQVAELKQRVRRLSARGEVPSFVGQDVSEAEADDAVATYNWKVKTTEQISSEAPGTVLSQSPPEGTSLRAGRSITLVVAKKAPPKPKEWVTIQTLTGADSTKTDEFTIPGGVKARLLYDMPGDTNNVITLYRKPKEYVDLLLNEIGPQNGSTRLYEPGTFYLDVTGRYTIQVQVFKRPQ